MWTCSLLRCSILGIAVLLVAVATTAQDLEFAGSPNVVGSGGRALGMGGAFIAVADDATAASWNPAGLVQLERPEISLVYEYSKRSEDFGDGHQPLGLNWYEFPGKGEIHLGALNFASAVYPIPRPFWGRNAVLSLSYQRRYDLNRSIDVNTGFSGPLPLLGNLFAQMNQRYRSRGSLNAVTPAAAIEITKRLSAGLALNFYRPEFGPNGWDEVVRGTTYAQFYGSIITGFGTLRTEWDDFTGENFTAGILWNPTDRLSIGAVYHSPLVGNVSRSRINTAWTPPGLPGFGITLDEKWRIEFPEAWGLGVAYRFPNDKLTISIDVTQRRWDNYAAIDSKGQRFSPVTAKLKSLSDVDPVYTVRAGLEYVFVKPDKFVQNYLPSLRFGVVYDPEPASGRPADIWALSFGAGVLLKDRVNIDFAYQFRFGDNVRWDTIGRRSGTDADIRQHQFLLSTVIYF